MNEAKQLSRLESVPLRDYWEREDSDFTPWLANPENLSLLGDVLGLELEVDAQEENVGPFRADIVCRAPRDNSIVLIENQLETTNHSHLGQLFTYAAGLDAVTIIWIASRFSEEHRAAVDWLNRISHDQFNFFALQIELLRIGDSDAAPRFNIIAKPNNWARQAVESMSSNRPRTELQQLTVDYWTSFGDYMQESGSSYNPPTPYPSYWRGYGVGRSGFGISILASMRDRFIGVEIGISSNDANSEFDSLHQDETKIHQELGFEMDWQRKSEQKSCLITCRRDADTTNRQCWPELHQWTLERLESLNRVFRPRIAAL